MGKKTPRLAAVTCAVWLVMVFAGQSAAAIGQDVVNSAWKRIAAAAGMEPIAITYEPDKSPNAWVNFKSANNYTVHVTQGLMQLLDEPDEIAGILGHEMGHIKRGHYSKGVQRNILWSGLGFLTKKAGAIGEIVGAMGMDWAEKGFSKEQEVEADDYGVDISKKAEYSAWGLYMAMKKFKDNGYVTKPKGLEGFISGFNSHPITDLRLRHLEERAQKIEPKPAGLK